MKDIARFAENFPQICAKKNVSISFYILVPKTLVDSFNISCVPFNMEMSSFSVNKTSHKPNHLAKQNTEKLVIICWILKNESTGRRHLLYYTRYKRTIAITKAVHPRVNTPRADYKMNSTPCARKQRDTARPRPRGHWRGHRELGD